MRCLYDFSCWWSVVYWFAYREIFNTRGKEVVLFDNLTTGHREFVPTQVPFVEGDLANREHLHHLFENYPNIHPMLFYQ